MSRSIARIMAGHFRKATRSPEEYSVFAMSDDPKIWYILIRNIKGDDDEFTGGEFLFEMFANDKFPAEPPRFYARTPNGVYEKDKICCISIGQYHAKSYRPVEGMRGFAIELANGLMNYEGLYKSGGINIIKTTIDEKKYLTKNSIKFNWEYYPHIMRMLEDQYAEYAPKWDMKNTADIEKYSFGKVIFAKKSPPTDDKTSDDKPSDDKTSESDESAK